MYQTKTGRYDEIPEGMKRYINNYGCHFNKKLYEEAVSRMFTIEKGEKKRMKPFTKELVDTLLRDYGVTVERNKLYDGCYVASMCKADFLGRSIPDDAHLTMYVKDVLDDPDAEEGFVFNRWYADQMFMNKPIEWEDMI